jgi:hypothetical protein
MADAYSLNLTTGALMKNGTALANLLEVKCSLNFDFAPGPAEGPAPQYGFYIEARIHDTAADARILAQGPAGLLGSNVAAFAGTPSRYRLRSKTGDTLTLTNPPASITAAPLEGASVDGFAP